MRQAHLRLGSVTLLRAEQIRHPLPPAAPRPPRSGVLLVRLGASSCSTAPSPTRAHSHHARPATRAEVSSERATRLARTRSSTAAVCFVSRAASLEQVDRGAFAGLQPEDLPEQPRSRCKLIACV